MWTSQLQGSMPSAPRASNSGLIVFEMAESPFGIILGVRPARGAICRSRRASVGSPTAEPETGRNRGWVRSRIRNIALATEIAPNASATIVVGLVPEKRSAKPQKRNIDQRITLVTSDQATGLDSCRDIKSRVCSINARLALVAASASF